LEAFDDLEGNCKISMAKSALATRMKIRFQARVSLPSPNSSTLTIVALHSSDNWKQLLELRPQALDFFDDVMNNFLSLRQIIDDFDAAQ